MSSAHYVETIEDVFNQEDGRFADLGPEIAQNLALLGINNITDVLNLACELQGLGENGEIRLEVDDRDSQAMQKLHNQLTASGIVALAMYLHDSLEIIIRTEFAHTDLPTNWRVVGNNAVNVSRHPDIQPEQYLQLFTIYEAQAKRIRETFPQENS